MRLKAVDLFCGAGGSSTGLARAAERAGRKVDLLAINHWQVAVETHAANHPWAEHLCQRIEAVDPNQAVTGKLDLLVASPECVHHSNARGGRPMNDQSRASAWHVVHWAERLRPAAILVENVREFATWGPLGTNGRPLKSRRGETFAAWVGALRSLGYTVEWRALNSADYGDPTTRERLYVIARRGKGPVPWPEPTHAPPGRPRLLGGSAPWRAAREIIDWEFKGSSIFGRKRPLAEKTLARIAEGLRRFGGAAADPFLVEPFILPPLGIGRGNAPRSIHKPVQTVLASRGGGHLVEPFLVGYYGNGQAHRVADPCPTVTTKDRFALVEPGARLDILFRMLTPRELARAMGFPDSYEFKGNRGDVVRQIGNAVSVGIAEALCSALVGGVA